jgi:hypothetical protein
MASTLTKAVLAELEAMRASNAALRAQVGNLEAVLAPAFPRQPRQMPQLQRDWAAPRSWCGEGDCRPAGPCKRCQGAAPGQRSPARTSDPWQRDYEHSPEFMDSAHDTRLGELRQRSAREDQMRQQAAARAAGPSVLFESRVFCGTPGCRPATPCQRCAGHVNRVMDKSGEQMGGDAQRTLVHAAVPELGSDRPGYVSPGVGAIGTIPMPGGTGGRE